MHVMCFFKKLILYIVFCFNNIVLKVFFTGVFNLADIKELFVFDSNQEKDTNKITQEITKQSDQKTIRYMFVGFFLNRKV